MAREIDLTPACEAFVAVARQESFTLGAASIGVAQPVVSRRIAALERAMGGRLLQRSSRRVALTRLGRRLLPVSEQLVAAAEGLRSAAERHRAGALTVALPEGAAEMEIAYLAARAHRHGLALDIRALPPDERRRQHARELVDLAVVTSAADVADWSSPLGLAGTEDHRGIAELSGLRRGRRNPHPPIIWGTPEDDVPQVRDPLELARDAWGLAPEQVQWTDAIAAITRAVTHHDLVLTTRIDAERYGLRWRRLAEPALLRSHALLVTADRPDAREPLAPLIAELLHPEFEGDDDAL